MTDTPLPFPPGPVAVRAIYLGQRLDLRALEASSRLAVAPTAVRAGAAGVAVLFRYGAIVLYNVAPLEEATFVSQLLQFTSQPFSEPELEEATLRIEPEQEERALDDAIRIRELTIDRLQCIADILAKSVVLAHTEASMARVFDRIEPLSQELEQRGTVRRGVKELLKHIGGTLYVQTEMVARVEVLEKPELLWDHPQLELLYARLEAEYELSERHHAVERKLGLISRTAETLLGLLQHDRALRVEWYIVGLIVAEICLTVYQLFVL